jgi:hypothetical protein
LALGVFQNQIAGTLLRILIMGLAVLIPIWMSRRGVDPYTQFGAVIFMLLFIAPGFGVQYLVWAVPFVITLGLGWSIAYYLSAGVFIFVLFDYWSSGAWYFADSHTHLEWNRFGNLFAYLCWAVIGQLLIRYSQVVRRLKIAN